MSGLIGIPPLKTEQPAQANATEGDLVRDIEQNEFSQFVMEGSMERPVIVDFWADWCGPCKTLAPLLEKVVLEAGGAVLLAKVNTETNQELAAQLRIQSLPTVYAFFQGRPIDGFQGALPESEIRKFVDKLIADTGATAPGQQDPGVDEAIAQANELLEAGQPEQAEALAGQLMQAIGITPALGLVLAKALSAQGKDEELNGFLESLDDEVAGDPELKAFQAGLALRKEGEGLGTLAELRANAASGEQSAKFDLARKLLSTGERDEAAAILIDMFRQDRDWEDGAAKNKLLEIFNIYGNADPFTLATRRKFTAVLYS